ncbi:EamA family transporter [Vibrio sagamiensis]|uniref:EamA family transporter n=1 Tax=Vibrio sagamiensis TaxID=512650 RepID=UPI0003A5DDAA|nr:EamA family transporter [Vibrio sagamiensis]
MPSKLSNTHIGVIFGMIFCFISAIFDVYVGNLSQKLSPAIIIVYCFISSMLLFFSVSIYRSGIRNYYKKISSNFRIILLINLSVVCNWGGLIVSLKYLEPAVVGIATIACGPAITIVFSRFFKVSTQPTNLELIISWLILAIVIIMLGNSYFGNSGITETSTLNRIIGIICVTISAFGTVAYTLLSKELNNDNWKSYEILGVRNILIVVFSVIYCITNKYSMELDSSGTIMMTLLVTIGHIIPIFLIQKTISKLTPIHTSLVLLFLPIFTLILQYLDERVELSWYSIYAVSGITFLLFIQSINKLKYTL